MNLLPMLKIKLATTLLLLTLCTSNVAGMCCSDVDDVEPITPIAATPTPCSTEAIKKNTPSRSCTTTNATSSVTDHAQQTNEQKAAIMSESKISITDSTKSLVVRKDNELRDLLYSELNPMPMDLVNIIVSYNGYELKGTLTQTLPGHNKSWPNCLTPLTNGYFASGSADCTDGSFDCTIKIWAPDTNSQYTCIQTLHGHSKAITSIIQLTNGYLASGSWDGTIKLWAPGTNGQYTYIQTLHDDTSEVRCLAPLANGYFASASENKTLKIWVPNMNNQYTCIQTLHGHPYAITGITQLTNGCLASFSLYSIGRSSIIIIWSPDINGQYSCIQKLVFPTRCGSRLTKLNNGDFAATPYIGTINIYTRSINEQYNCSLQIPHGHHLAPVIQLKNGYLATTSLGANGDCINIWDLTNGKASCIKTFNNHSDEITCLAELTNGWLASASEDKTIKIWK